SGGITPEDVTRERLIAETDRCLAAFDEGRMVGGAMAASMRLTAPGGAQVLAAGVTAVGVQPTHRRRGINTALMRAQLDDVRSRGEPIAVLYASEGGIYGRFGYGSGSFLGEIDIEVDRATFIRGYRSAGRVRLLPRGEALPAMRPVYDRAQAQRPGMIALDDRWWGALFFEGESEKEDPTFFAVHDTDGVVDAYATYRVKHEWAHSLPNLELTVKQLIATTPQAYADIWRYLFDIDLVRRVKAWNRPVDEPLFLLMREPRRLRFRTGDGLWVRLVDVSVALAARGYAGDGRLVVQVEDPFCSWNEGRHALHVDGGGASCGRTDDDADIACSATDLGATYLGGVTFRQLHRAGRIDELRPGGLERADALFASDPAPWSSVPF
ncbi:MAG: GNAT family N-acetyltransferase, partial [Actinomycetota bacterium]